MVRKLNCYLLLFVLTVLGSACSESDEPEISGDGIASPEESGSGEKDGYQLVWEDLFNGSALDTDKWQIEVNGNGGGNNELQYYRRENISLGDEPVSGNSCLIITARKESYQGKTVTSGRLNTMGKYVFTHGKVEARIKAPSTANGLWPAFWLLGADYLQVNWPGCGEIDIMEMGHVDGIRNNLQDRYFNGACHWGYYTGTSYPNYAKHSVAGYSLQDDFHLYTLIWDESSLKMYLDLDKYPDVKPYYAMDIDNVSSADSPGNYFHKDFFIVLNMAVGGNFTQIWDINNVTALGSGEAKMYVDFVKVYQKK